MYSVIRVFFRGWMSFPWAIVSKTVSNGNNLKPDPSWRNKLYHLYMLLSFYTIHLCDAHWCNKSQNNYSILQLAKKSSSQHVNLLFFSCTVSRINIQGLQALSVHHENSLCIVLLSPKITVTSQKLCLQLGLCPRPCIGSCYFTCHTAPLWWNSSYATDTFISFLPNPDSSFL